MMIRHRLLGAAIGLAILAVLFTTAAGCGSSGPSTSQPGNVVVPGATNETVTYGSRTSSADVASVPLICKDSRPGRVALGRERMRAAP